MTEFLVNLLSLVGAGGTSGLLVKALADKLSGRTKKALRREAELWRHAVHVLEELAHQYRVALIDAGLEPGPWPAYDRPSLETPRKETR